MPWRIGKKRKIYSVKSNAKKHSASLGRRKTYKTKKAAKRAAHKK